MSDEEHWLDLNVELADVWVERFLHEVPCSDLLEESLRSQAWNAPGEAAGSLLGGYVLGEWDLTQPELDRLWLIGRLVGGYLPEELVHPEILAKAVPGREVLPADPVGYDLVQTPLLEGGGHGPRRGRPGKREFPATWSDDDAVRHTMDVARHPSLTVQLPSGAFRAAGERDGVRMSVLVSAAGDVLTSYPVHGPGVVQNPLDAERAPHVERLAALLDQLVPHGDDEPRRSLDELLAVGEWPHVIAGLRALDLPLDPTQRAQLTELAQLTR